MIRQHRRATPLALAIALLVTSFLALAGAGTAAPAPGDPVRHQVAQASTALRIVVTGLPRGVKPLVRVAGPGTKRTISASGASTLHVRPGTYTLRTAGRHRSGAGFYPADPVLRVKVRQGHVKTARVDYAIRVAGEATVVRPADVSDVQATGSTTVVTFSSNRAAPAVGDVVAVGVGPETPSGVYGEVASVSGREAVLRETTLFDALPTGVIDTKFRISQADLPPTAAKAGWRWDERSGGLTNNVGKLIECRGGVRLSVGGQISLDPVFELKADWGFLRLDSLEFTGTIQESAELSASLSAAAECGAERVPVFQRPISLRPITVQVGPVPVVLVPQIQIYLSARASAEAKVEVGVGQKLGITAGLRYTRSGGVTPIARVTNSLTRQGPGVTGTATATASISPQFALLLYGVAGPHIDLSGGLSFKANIHDDPWWTLQAFLSGGAGLSIPLLGVDVSKGDMISKTWTLAQADGPFLGEPDHDSDGFSESQDCNDAEASIHPGAVEVPNDGIDQDCDGFDSVLHSGAVQATLTWGSSADLDLHVRDTLGDEIWYAWPGPSSGGGTLDQDDNAACRTASPAPIENVYWSESGAPQGRYYVWVEVYDACGQNDLDWHLVVRVDGAVVIDERGSGSSPQYSFFKQGG